MLKLSVAREPNGFYNIGMICYFNSLLQSLISCTQIADININKKSQNDLLNEYIKLVNDNNPISTQSISVLKCLMEKLQNSKNKSQFGHWQESASEGLVLFMEQMPKNINELILHRQKKFVMCGNCGKCGNTTESYNIHFEMFGTNIKSVDELVRHLLLNSECVPDYICDFCHKTNPRTIQYEKLDMLPEIVVLLYNKYNEEEHLKTHFVPAEFVISNLKYKQVAQIRHYGNLNGGHYTACVARDDKIYLCNDSNISHGDLNPNSAAYMVFYSYAGSDTN